MGTYVFSQIRNTIPASAKGRHGLAKIINFPMIWSLQKCKNARPLSVSSPISRICPRHKTTWCPKIAEASLLLVLSLIVSFFIEPIFFCLQHLGLDFEQTRMMKRWTIQWKALWEISEIGNFGGSRFQDVLYTISLVHPITGRMIPQ